MLGGTAWLGREIARQALARGHRVTCLARGTAGAVVSGAQHVRADRGSTDAYEAVADRDWDWVVDVSWQPGWVRQAAASIGPRAKLWTYVSSGNVYARHDMPDADENSQLLDPTEQDTVDASLYGPAKVACELACQAAVGDRLLIARAGLIGGPGDTSGRSGYWVARAARDNGAPLLVPDSPDAPTQVIDVRDLAAWLVSAAERAVVGIFNAVGPVVPLSEWIDICRRVAGHTGAVVIIPPQWLIAHDVREYMGAGSLPMWMIDPAYRGWSRRSGHSAALAGLTHRPRTRLVHDLLEWERAEGLDRDRRCGLTTRQEQDLIAAYRAA